MAKRGGDTGNLVTKKQKINDLDDLWDDEFDGDAIDDCFERASQICEQENNTTQNNVTLLTSYSVFKKSNGIFRTSTQLSQHCETHPENLENKLKQLQEKLAEKEGEVVILRTNLQNLRTTCQAEQEKKDKEWKDKLNSTQKENKTIKSELEFKNLEIANLKQQIVELSRCVNIEQNITQKSKINERLSSPKKPVRDMDIPNLCSKIQVNSKICYPLKHLDFSSLFKLLSEEKSVNRTKHSLNELSNLQYSSSQEFDLNYVYAELVFLTNLSLDEIDSEKTLPSINKVLCVTLQLLTNLNDYLKEVEDNIQMQDIQESDSQYLQDNSNLKYETLENCSGSCSKAVGVKCGNLIGFLADLFPFSTYFRNYLLEDQPLNLNENLDYIKFLPCFTSNTRKKFLFLTLILNICSIIGRTRKEKVSSEFLCAVIKLLCKIFSFNDSRICVNNLVHDITKEVFFLRPKFIVIYFTTYLLKAASRNLNFIGCLCLNPSQNKTNSSTKGILYFNRGSCRFHLFVILLENSLPKIKEQEIILKISLNILSFIFNIFKLNSSLLHQLENGCSCLCQLYKLGIGVIYKNLKSYQEFKHGHLHSYKTVFKNGINVLHLLTSNSYDLTQKYVTDFARFKEIVHTLTQLSEEIGLNDDDLKNLEKLSLIEDFPEISPERFAGIEL